MPSRNSAVPTNSSHNRALGRVGENLAVEFLHRQGYIIISRNWRGANAEIDIVARLSGLVVFVEVKTRRSAAFGLPVEAITAVKQEHMKRAAMAWLVEHRQPIRAVRFDAISIIVAPNGNHEISHFAGIDI